MTSKVGGEDLCLFSFFFCSSDAEGDPVDSDAF